MFLLSSVAFAAQGWQMLPAESAMSYQNPAAGGTIPISDFKADIAFDPSQLSSSYLNFSANAGSLFVPAEDFSPEMRQPKSNLGAVIPDSPSTAVFTSRSIQRTGDNSFTATGELEIYGQRRALSIPFTVSLRSGAGTTARMVLSGSFTARRADYAKGEDYSKLGPSEVPVTFRFTTAPQ